MDKDELRELVSQYAQKNIDRIVDGLFMGIVGELRCSLEDPDEYNSDQYGFVYYQGTSPELFKELGLIEDSKRFTHQAEELYEEFQKAGFYNDE